MKLQKFAAATLVAFGAMGGLGTAHAVPVALELSLVIDVSGSVSTTEYNTQADGYAAAFNNASVIAGILSYANGIAVNVIQFSDNAQQAIGWRHLNSLASIAQFAIDIGNMARLSNGGTDVEDGMRAGRQSFANNGFEGSRLVMDVSGDGHQNTDPACTDPSSFGNAGALCAATQAEAALATAAGITINGLAIEDGTYGASGLTTWYNNNVKTASGFVVTASGFAAFERAAITKIGREINETPEPASLALVGLALAAAGAASRRRRD